MDQLKASWNNKYNCDEFIYGTKPNDFLAQYAEKYFSSGKVLSLAEGEGRNAVYLAQLGLDVTAIDSSEVGLKKAIAFAKSHNVSINTICNDLLQEDLGEACWDGIVSIFFPLTRSKRETLHKRVIRALKPGGTLIIEAYRPSQIGRGTGGGSNRADWQSVSTIRKELKGLEFSHLIELERAVIEGTKHTGLGDVVQCIAHKP